ncbi:g1040 [Coccomyxa viridis]|uniref:G1040 protein n=1 Tax=Coccomyxa viridis TaxID=1274662 RepID=A0ABP1FK23_9CHLO
MTLTKSDSSMTQLPFPSTPDVQDQPEKGLSFQVWPSSRTLLRYLDHRQPQVWQGKRVIELGCGCGLVGLCFAACGAHVLLTDLPEPLDLIRSNIGLNQCTIDAAGGTAIAHELTWGVTQARQLPQQWQSPDVVVAADVVYRQELFQPLLSALVMLGGKDTVLLLAHVRRWKSDKRFFKALSKGFSVSDITSIIDKDADLLSSHTKGALRLFELRRHKTL